MTASIRMIVFWERNISEESRLSLYLVLVLHPPIILLLPFLGRVAVEHLRLVLHTSLISAQLCGLRRGKRACIIHCIHFIWTRRSGKGGVLGHTVQSGESRIVSKQNSSRVHVSRSRQQMGVTSFMPSVGRLDVFRF
jgi:hypothetical protein